MVLQPFQIWQSLASKCLIDQEKRFKVYSEYLLAANEEKAVEGKYVLSC